MDVHVAVRTLVAEQGANVLDDAQGFRGALDDYFDETVLSTGDTNLLVDAVRLGSLTFFQQLMASGGDADRAVTEAGVHLARERGGSEVGASTWAVAVLGFALGAVPDSTVRRYRTTPVPESPHALSQTRQLDPSPPPPPPVAPPPAPPPVQIAPEQAPTGPGRRGRAGLVVAVVGVVLAMVAGAFLAWTFFWPRGGADSPEEAVDGLLAAIEQQDIVAALDLISPAETEGMDEVYEALRERGEEEGLFADDQVTDAVHVELAGLTYEVDELTDGLARVTVAGGDYDLSWDPGRLPPEFDDRAAEWTDSEASGDVAELDDSEGGLAPALMTIEIDGRWYVTLLGSIADRAYLEAEAYEDADEPDWDAESAEVDPIAGDDPEEVVDNLVDAINNEDVNALLDNVDAELARPLRPYTDLVQVDLDGQDDLDPAEFEVVLEELELSSGDAEDGLVKVTIDHISGRASETTGDGTANATFEVEGPCWAGFDTYGDGGEKCLADVPAADELEVDAFFFVLREVDEGYQLDPIATLAEYADVVIDGATDKFLDELFAEID